MKLGRLADDVPDEHGRARVGRALLQKLPKLRRYAHKGALTALVIENGDLARTNSALLGKAISSRLERSNGCRFTP